MTVTDTSTPLRVAYLNTQYPSLSHTFIEREVRAVRQSGIEVQTFSLRPPGALGRLGADQEAAARTTIFLLDSLPALLLAQLSAARRPVAWLRAFLAGQRWSLPGFRARLRHLAYAAEGVRLAAEMRRRGIRHVHVHMANNGATTAMLACVYDPSLTYSVTVHAAEFFEIPVSRLDIKARAAVFVRCISNFCQAQVMAWTAPEDWPKCHIVHCGIDPGAFHPATPPTDGPFRILAVGRHVAIKGYPILLEACARLGRAGVDWRLDLVGDGPLRPFLERCAKEAGVADRVTFCGAVGQDKIQEYFDRNHVMVVSSFMEGVPVVLMEAMAKGMAVVAPRVGGVPELVEEGVSGLLVRPASPVELGDALAKLAANRSGLGEMGRAGRNRVVAEFTSATLGSEMARLFRRYLAPATDGVDVATPSVSPSRRAGTS